MMSSKVLSFYSCLVVVVVACKRNYFCKSTYFRIVDIEITAWSSLFHNIETNLILYLYLEVYKIKPIRVAYMKPIYLNFCAPLKIIYIYPWQTQLLSLVILLWHLKNYLLLVWFSESLIQYPCITTRIFRVGGTVHHFFDKNV